MAQLNVTACLDIYDGCAMSCEAESGEVVRLTVGEHEVELVFDAESFREFATMNTRALVRMDELCAEEEVRWEAEKGRSQAAAS